MPANLTPQYLKAEERYREAKDDRERLAALREMLSTLPKHKGTEKIQADLKRRIAQLRAEGTRRKGPRRGSTHRVERSGAAQVALVGPPNSGKSRLLADHTHAKPEVAPYPFTTWTPTPGLLVVDKIPLQLVDLPPVTADHAEPWLADILRNADLLLVLLDLGTDDVLDDWERVREALAALHVSLEDAPADEAGEAGLCRPRWVLGANKVDLPGARERLPLLQEATGRKRVHALSLETAEGCEEMFRALVTALDVVRIYTKEPGRPPDLGEPFVLPRGSTVEDAARAIHRDLAERFRLARAWGPRFHDGQPVGRDLVLEDGDVLEFHD